MFEIWITKYGSKFETVVWIIISTWKTTNQSPTFAGVSQSLSKPRQSIAGSGFEIGENRTNQTQY
jgi:hypothetical protein